MTTVRNNIEQLNLNIPMQGIDQRILFSEEAGEVVVTVILQSSDSWPFIAQSLRKIGDIEARLIRVNKVLETNTPSPPPPSSGIEAWVIVVIVLSSIVIIGLIAFAVYSYLNRSGVQLISLNSIFESDLRV